MTLDQISETEATTDEPVAVTEKAPRVKSHIDTANGAVVIDSIAYPIAGIPAGAVAHLALIGLRYGLTHTEDAAATFADLKAGKVSTRATAKPKEMDPKRLAYARALVETTKKSDQPHTLESAKERAATLSAADVKANLLKPLVAKHYSAIMNLDTSVA